VYEPDRYRFFDDWRPSQSCITIGAGLSLAPAFLPAVGGEVVSSRRFNRVLAFDSEHGEVTVEAGINLGELLSFSLRHGLYLPVQPGHPAITVGGCAAVNVHGKNPSRDGTILRHVRSLRLFHPNHGIVSLSPDSNGELFQLTVGGFGLTGHILDVTLKLRELPSAAVMIRTSPVADVLETPGTLQSIADQADLVFTWHDFTAKGEAFGRGFLRQGSFVDQGGGVKSMPSWLDEAELSYRTGVPFFGRFSTPLFNRLFGLMNLLGPKRRERPLFDLLFPVHNKTAYYRLFGKKGMIEYQVLMATEVWEQFIGEIRTRLSRRPLPITLGSAKLFDGDPSYLHFDGRGVCLALDFPRGEEGLAFAAFLDQLSIDLGLRPNICKDSRLPRQVVQQTFKEYDSCCQALRRFDPDRAWTSALAERLGL
jgi:decaprenylphospho-beta-D-ribofuranose 2-oxidase